MQGVCMSVTTSTAPQRRPTEADIAHLRALLPRRLPEHDAQGLIAHSLEVARVTCTRLHSHPLTFAVKVKRFEWIARACRELSAAVADLPAHYTAGDQAEFRQLLDAKAEVMEQYADTLRGWVSRGDRPQLRPLSGMVASVAYHYARTTGTLPPAADASWFAQYMAELASAHGLDIGPRLVVEGVRLARESLQRSS